MTLQSFGLYVLATYAVAFTQYRLDGPFGICEKIRGRFDPQQKTWIGRGLNCPICLSFWIGIPIGFFMGAWWFEWLAMVGAVIVLNKFIMR